MATTSNPVNPSTLVRLIELAADSPFSPRQLRDAIAAGDLRAYLIGRDYFIARADVADWIARHDAARPGVRRHCTRPRPAKPAPKPGASAVERALARGDLRPVTPRKAGRK